MPEADHAAPHFTLDEAMAAQQALRRAAGLGPETFALADLLAPSRTCWRPRGPAEHARRRGRGSGQADVALAALISRATGKPVSGAELAATEPRR